MLYQLSYLGAVLARARETGAGCIRGVVFPVQTDRPPAVIRARASERQRSPSSPEGASGLSGSSATGMA